MLHVHITTWALALILFIIAVGMQKGKNEKGLKIVQMILRLFYLLIIATGAVMLINISIDMRYVIKSILGIVVIGFFEMVLTRAAKGKSTGIFWGLLIFSFAAVVWLGYQLPL